MSLSLPNNKSSRINYYYYYYFTIKSKDRSDEKRLKISPHSVRKEMAILLLWKGRRVETKHTFPPYDGVHLKGPFISPCVYCPSCVWPRISLLRFVSPLQRSQCIFPTLRRGRVWHFDVVPRKGRREINDYTRIHEGPADLHGYSVYTGVGTQYLYPHHPPRWYTV